EKLIALQLFNTTEIRVRNGKPSIAKVPVTAAHGLAEGEFNRFYMRGLCRLAIEAHLGSLVVYRAKPVMVPRYDSEQKIGTEVSPSQLLIDLRTHIGVDTALGLPNGPNSGLSVRLAA